MMYPVSGGGNSSCDRCIYNEVLVDMELMIPCGKCIRANCSKYTRSDELKDFYEED